MWQKMENSSNTEIIRWKYGMVSINNSPQAVKLRPFDCIISTSPFQIQNAIIIESTQENKTLSTVDYVCEQMLSRGVNKQSTVYIQGGGMLLDLAGFCCSIFMRGVKKVVYIPTTLLSIVDATIGGKVGINWAGAKNMLGVISHPHQIRISLDYLKTLSDRDFSDGMAQVIKMATTHDEDLFKLLESKEVSLRVLRENAELLRQIVKKSLNIKMKVVEEDQFDKNSRKWLNFGHTIGHALELNRNSGDLKHGQCVSIGMLQEIKLGLQLGEISDETIYHRLKSLLAKFNLPTQLPENVDCEELMSCLSKDKKNETLNEITVTLIESIGIRKPRTSQASHHEIRKLLNKSIEIKIGDVEKMKRLSSSINQKWEDRFPSSKSLSIRYLYLAAIYYLKTREPITISNFLSSEDTECMKKSLAAMGFCFEACEQSRVIKVTGYGAKKQGVLDVGNSGLTARFILPLCGYLSGKWEIQCHERMSERPNEQIIRYCMENYDIRIEWHKSEMCFPMTINSKGQKQTTCRRIEMKSNKSSQFLSSVLINSFLNKSIKQIVTASGKLVSESYIKMTIFCLQQFGAQISFKSQIGQNLIVANMSNGFAKVESIRVEKDLSSLSYPFAFSLIHEVQPPQVPSISSQGDLLFYHYCSNIQQIPSEISFSECTDTFMTMAILIASGICKPPRDLNIYGISNQRLKESNRIQLTRLNLQKVGYYAIQHEDGLIFPASSQCRQLQKNEVIVFQTAGDHRLAMSMGVFSSILSLQQPHARFIVDDREAVKKTFPEFWNYFQQAGVQLSIENSEVQLKQQLRNTRLQNSNRVIVTGNRGSGKSTVAKIISEYENAHLVDLDIEITKFIKQEQGLSSISEYIEKYGWQQFRVREGFELQKAMATNSEKKLIISTGGGIIENKSNIGYLQAYARHSPVIYLEKRFSDLKVQLSETRPHIADFEQRSKLREQMYAKVANSIITIPSLKIEELSKFVIADYRRIMSDKKLSELNSGEILCMAEIGPNAKMSSSQLEGLVGIEIRCDHIFAQLKQEVDQWKELRFKVAEFKRGNLDHIADLPLILTLRSKRQYGQFEGDYCAAQHEMSKIPTNFLDHEVINNVNFDYNFNKLLFSYHGSSQQQIQYLLSKTAGTKKLCYNGPNQQFFNKCSAMSDICVDLNNNLSRLSNKYRMISRQTASPGPIRIPTRAQLGLMRSLVNLLR